MLLNWDIWLVETEKFVTVLCKSYVACDCSRVSAVGVLSGKADMGVGLIAK